MALVITSCTNRKRKPVPAGLKFASLEKGALPAVAAGWGRRLAAATERHFASDVYGGRGFQEAARAAKLLDARLLIVSAGLGLIEADTAIPAYGCTVLPDTADSVHARILGDCRLAAWWSALRSTSPFARPLAELVQGVEGAILVALSGAYLDILAPEISSLPPEALLRVRIFTRASVNRISPDLRPLVMPYDDRLDGPDSSIRGTRSDFASRALAHFVELGVAGTPAGDAVAVRAETDGWRMPDKVERVRHDDAAIVALMHEHWNAAGGSSSRLLRVFRDDLGVACEQSRFAALARQVRGERG